MQAPHILQLFLSYRHDDSGAYVSRLYDHLIPHFGKENIFLDENQIKTATKFPDQIKNALDRSDILLAVIGPQWATINDSNGNPRIHDPDDWVRIEIETAIARKLPIIPILVNNASPVVASDLPSSIHEITLIQALPFHNEHNAFEHDIERLVVIIHDKHIDILCPKS